MPCRIARGLCKTRCLLALLLASACAAPSAAPARAESQTAPTSTTAAPPSAAASPSASRADVPPQVAAGAVTHCEVPADASSAAASELPFQFTLVREGRFTTLAVNERKVAAFGDPHSAVFDGKRWQDLPELEPSERPRHLELFFGRDDQPRAMGYLEPRQPSAALEPFYRRFKQGRWQREPGELGALASGGGALYGVLGPLDPEVVCRPKALCLVKRISGWSRIPAHDAPVRIVLAGDTAWALWPGHLQRLEASGFADWGPARAWRDPRAIWVEKGGAPWVLEPSERALFRLESGAWHKLDTPFSESSALWGSEPSGVWLTGSGGVAHFDGKAWRCVPGVRGPLSAITHLGDDIWLAGAAGVYRGVLRVTR